MNAILNAHLRCAAGLLCATFSLVSPADARADEPPLGPQPIESAIAADGSFVTSLPMHAGDAARIRWTESGIDLQLKVSDPAGAVLIDNAGAGWRDDATIDLLASKDGAYRLELIPKPKQAGEGKLTLSLVEAPHAATDADRARYEGQDSSLRGLALMKEGSSESVRQARTAFEQAIAAYERANSPFLQGEALDELGGVYDAMGDYRNALATYTRALPFRVTAGDRRGEARTIEGIGLAQLYLGEYDAALESNRKVLAIARALADKASEAGTLHNIGGIYWSTDEMQKALDYYLQALAIERSAGLREYQASTINNIGDTYRRLGDYDKALEYFNQALALRRELGNRRGEAVSLHTIALVYFARGETQKALDNFTKALEIRRATGDRRGEAYSLGGSALAFYALGDSAKAIEYQQQALELWKQIGERRAEAETLQDMGFVYTGMKEYDKASALFEKALPMSRELSDHTYTANALFGLAKTKRAQGNLEAAKADIEEALDITESLRGRIASRELRTSYFASVQKFYAFYVDLLMEIQEKRSDASSGGAALEVAERARARTLLDAIGEAGIDFRRGVDPKLLAQQSKLATSIAMNDRKRIRLSAESGDKDAIAAVNAAIAHDIEEYETISAKLRACSPRYTELTQPRTATIAEMQSLLDDDTILLEYFLGENRSFAWALTKNGLKTAVLPPGAEVEALARKVYAALSTRTKSGEKSEPGDLRALSAMLLSPFELKAPRIVVVADGALAFLPFSALIAGDGPLITSREVVTLPSLSVLSVLREKSEGKRPTHEVAVFADPVFRSDDPRVAPATSSHATSGAGTRGSDDVRIGSLKRLRFSRSEADAIRRIVPGNSMLEALDFDASRAHATDGTLADYRIVHFATHGILDSEHPQLSALVLSLVNEKGEIEDGFLHLHDIYNLQLNADLVVLSACQTALGKEIRGEGLIGMTRGFMYAGAPRVVATLWQVDDRATAELMKRFYSGMYVSKLSPAAALRAAQLSMRKDPRWESPYYWAGFLLQGEWK